jgi:hypothetical protein
MGSLEDLVLTVETWQTQRKVTFDRHRFSDGSNAKSLREFVEIQNALSRRVVTLFEKQDPDFFTSLGELVMHASGMVTGAKTFVNGQDVTND